MRQWDFPLTQGLGGPVLSVKLSDGERTKSGQYGTPGSGEGKLAAFLSTWETSLLCAPSPQSPPSSAKHRALKTLVRYRNAVYGF